MDGHNKTRWLGLNFTHMPYYMYTHVCRLVPFLLFFFFLGGGGGGALVAEASAVVASGFLFLRGGILFKCYRLVLSSYESSSVSHVFLKAHVA